MLFLLQSTDFVPNGSLHESNSGRVLITAVLKLSGKNLTRLRNDFSAPPIPKPETTSIIENRFIPQDYQRYTKAQASSY
jgi:hypothetical protein